jgi:hypothetical protein
MTSLAKKLPELGDSVGYKSRIERDFGSVKESEVATWNI